MAEGEPRREFRRTRVQKGREIPGKGTQCRRRYIRGLGKWERRSYVNGTKRTFVHVL